MNLFILTGNIGQIESKVLPSGTTVTSFSLAVNKGIKQQDGSWKNETKWFPITLFRETKLMKGDMVNVTGYIDPRMYEKDGVKHYTTDYIAHTVELLKRPEQKKSEDLQPRADDFPFS